MGLLLLGTSACRPFANDQSRNVVPGTEAAYETAGAPGAIAHELVSAKHFRTVTIEIQPVAGQAFTQEAINQLSAFLRQHLNKPDGIKIQVNPPIAAPTHPAGQNGYTLFDVRRIEASTRKHYTEKGKLTVFVLALDWNSADDDDTNKILGQAHQTSSIVIYQNTIRNLVQAAAAATTPTTPKPSLTTAQATVLLHEFGHTLGLVGMDESKGSPENEDTAHPHHCNNPQCLMYFSSETGAGVGAITGGQTPKLDEKCEKLLKQYQ